MNKQGCAFLAAAIVRQAIKDWFEGSEEMKADCEIFFSSEWYQELKDLAPNTIPVNITRRLNNDST